MTHFQKMTNMPLIYKITLRISLKKSPSLVASSSVFASRILHIPLRILDHVLLRVPCAGPGNRRIMRIPMIVAGIQDRNGVHEGLHDLCDKLTRGLRFKISGGLPKEILELGCEFETSGQLPDCLTPIG